jgi:hypothetical protein
LLFDFMLCVLAVRVAIRHIRELQCLHVSLQIGESTQQNEKGAQQTGEGAEENGVSWSKRLGRGWGSKGWIRASMMRMVVGATPASIVEVMLRDSILYYFAYVLSTSPFCLPKTG